MYERSERVVRDRIEATRERMGETIEEIGERVNPTRVRRELKANVKRKARNTMRDVEHGVTETGRGIWNRIRENPIPAGMVGVGLAWLMANGGDERASRREVFAGDDLSPYGGYPRGGVSRGYEDESSEEQGRAAQAVDEVREKGHEAADRLREKGHDAMDTAREKGSELKHRAEESMHDAREQASQWGHEAKYLARRIEHRVEDSVQENPIAAGAIAAALGFAAGMMIPETRQENEMFGSTRDRLMDRAESKARQAGTKAKEVARETGESAKRAVNEAVDEVMHTDGREGESQSVSEPGR